VSSSHSTPVTATSTLLSGPELDDTASSMVFYVSVGGALGSVVIMATVVIICYLVTAGKAKNLDSSQRCDENYFDFK